MRTAVFSQNTRLPSCEPTHHAAVMRPFSLNQQFASPLYPFDCWKNLFELALLRWMSSSSKKTLVASSFHQVGPFLFYFTGRQRKETIVNLELARPARSLKEPVLIDQTDSPLCWWPSWSICFTSVLECPTHRNRQMNSSQGKPISRKDFKRVKGMWRR